MNIFKFKILRKNAGDGMHRQTNFDGKEDDHQQGTKGSLELQYTEEQLTEIFRRFDSNCDGRLSKQDLRNAFNSLGARLPSYRAFAALRRADENGKGYVQTDSDWKQLVQYAYKCGYTVEDD